jgi:hypothetical protein
MNALIEKGLGLFPAYFRDLISLVTGPKTFVAAGLKGRRQFEKAFIFLGISYAIGFILKLSLFRQDPLFELGKGAAFTLVQAVSYGGAIWLAWRAVGGNGTLAGTLVISLYYTAVMDYILGFLILGLLGSIRMTDPALYTEILEATRNGTLVQLSLQADRLASSNGVQLGLLMALTIAIVAVIWLIAGWGAYRAQHHVGPGMSIPAFVLFVVLCVPVAAVTFVIANALS